MKKAKIVIVVILSLALIVITGLIIACLPLISKFWSELIAPNKEYFIWGGAITVITSFSFRSGLAWWIKVLAFITTISACSFILNEPLQSVITTAPSTAAFASMILGMILSNILTKVVDYEEFPLVVRKVRKSLVTLMAAGTVLFFIGSGLSGNLNSNKSIETESTLTISTKATAVEKFLAKNNAKKSFSYKEFDVKPVKDWPVITFEHGRVIMSKNGSGVVRLRFNRIKIEAKMTYKGTEGIIDTPFILKTKSGSIKVPAGASIYVNEIWKRDFRKFSYRDIQFAEIEFKISE